MEHRFFKVTCVVTLLLTTYSFGFAQRGGRGGRPAAAAEPVSKTAQFQIAGLPKLDEADCKDVYKPIDIPGAGGDAFTTFTLRDTKMVALHHMLARLTEKANPITYNAGKNELSIEVPEEFGKAETLKIPLYPMGKGPEKLRTMTQMGAQGERLIVAALIEKSAAKDRPAVEIKDPENGNGLTLTDQDILKKIDVLRALKSGPTLAHPSQVIYLSIRNSKLRLTASSHRPLEYKLNLEKNPEKEFHRIINGFYQLKVPPFLGMDTN